MALTDSHHKYSLSKQYQKYNKHISTTNYEKHDRAYGKSFLVLSPIPYKDE